MLTCVSHYRNQALGLDVEPGMVLRDLSEELEAQLLRDSPGSFVVGEVKAVRGAPKDKMVRGAEHKDEAMSTETHAAIVPGKGGA